jgi:hypothetical protein
LSGLLLSQTVWNTMTIQFLFFKNLPSSRKPDKPRIENAAGSGTGMAEALKMSTCNAPFGFMFDCPEDLLPSPARL